MSIKNCIPMQRSELISLCSRNSTVADRADLHSDFYYFTWFAVKL